MNALDARLEARAMTDGGSMRYAHDDEQDWTPPDSWLLADALDRVAREMGWHSYQRGTAEDEVTVAYRRPSRHRPVETVDDGR